MGAFGEVVRRHVDLVYGMRARRQMGEGGGAEDVTQGVFFLLADAEGRGGWGAGRGMGWRGGC